MGLCCSLFGTQNESYRRVFARFRPVLVSVRLYSLRARCVRRIDCRSGGQADGRTSQNGELRARRRLARPGSSPKVVARKRTRAMEIAWPGFELPRAVQVSRWIIQALEILQTVSAKSCPQAKPDRSSASERDSVLQSLSRMRPLGLWPTS